MLRRVSWRWWTSFAIFAALGLAWVLATPLFAAPDEPAHVVRAASVGRGQLLGTTPPADQQVPPIGDAATVVTAPGIYRSANRVACLAGHPNRPASCVAFHGSSAETHVQTYVGHHSPAYYAPVGFLSRVVSPGAGQVYLMRIIGMLAIAALLASALETLRRTVLPMWAGAGFAIALSPMVLFLGATVSPSGVEIGSAIAVWVHGSVLAKEADDRVDPKVVDRLGIAACVLVLSRALSPLWLAVLGLVLLILTSRSGLRALVHSRRVWIWAGVLAACTAAQLWWYAYGHPLSYFVGTPVHGSGVALVRTSFGKSSEMLREMIGVFGWLETRAPAVTYLVWLLALGAIVALALAVASARFVWALLAATAAAVVIPVLVEAAGAHEAGFIWQGRYSLPLAVGVPIIAGVGVGSSETASRLGRRLALVLVASLAVAQILAFTQAIRRYAVGAHGPLWFFGHGQWSPPGTAPVLIVGFALAIAAGLWWIVLAPPRWRGHGGEGSADLAVGVPTAAPVAAADAAVTV
ncbi:MAG TPA: DUF2142 domain-containing protein [Acidimicrobiia bacterium]